MAGNGELCKEASEMSFKCCAEKGVKVAMCVICGNIFHFSCLERMTKFMKLDKNRIVCCELNYRVQFVCPENDSKVILPYYIKVICKDVIESLKVDIQLLIGIIREKEDKYQVLLENKNLLVEKVDTITKKNLALEKHHEECLRTSKYWHKNRVDSFSGGLIRGNEQNRDGEIETIGEEKDSGNLEDVIMKSGVFSGYTYAIDKIGLETTTDFEDEEYWGSASDDALGVEVLRKVRKRSISGVNDNKESQHLIVKSVENQKSKNVADWIPHRYREHLQFFKENGNILSCQPCKVNLAKDSEMLKKHIRLSSHQGLSKLLVRYTFYCEICNVKFTDEVAWNKHFTEGPNRHVLMAESRKSKVTEYECTKCLMVIFGDELSLARHISDRSRKDKKNEKKEPQLPEQVKRMFKSVENIEAESMKLLDEANNSLNGKQLTQECCTSLEKALSSVFPGCHVHPFGSRISGLGNEHSDLDVFVDTGDMFLGDKNQDPLAQVQLVRKAAAALTKLREEFQEVCQVPTARTPIVKLYHRKARIECDLSFRHGLSVENTKFIRFCIDIQPITQPFILMLKKWSFYNNLQEHITTYALALLAIFYLQINNYLLSVKKIKELNPAEAQTINGWETINYKMPVHQIKNHVSRYEHSISRLLKDFFDYYSKFDYEKQVVCPLLGYTINKNLFEGKGERLPPVMHTYVQQLSSKEPEQFRINSLFCVQDPFDLSHNLTKACQQGIVAKFKNMCGLSWRHLSSLT
nr:speckle targeted PIP5K1A-regulated poly(A) polymerase-like isoform X2 [Leptinotarsa decemlineata]